MKIFHYFILLLALLMAFVIMLTVFVHPFLSVNEPIQSKNLVIESWLKAFECEEIIDQSKANSLENIFVIGPKFDDDRKKKTKLGDFEHDEFFKWENKKGVLLLTNSTLLVDLLKLTHNGCDSIRSIIVIAGDTQKNKVYAHFNVALNGILLGSSFVNDSLLGYAFYTNAQLSESSLLSICFDNDYYSSQESRNLYVESIQVNGLGYTLSETNGLITRDQSILTTGFVSTAAQTARYLTDLNVNPEILKIVEFETTANNQTLAAAQQLKRYFKNSPPENLNVSSVGLHARRTWLTYKNVLPIEQLGIFNVELKEFDRHHWYKSIQGIQKMMDELTSYIYVWFYLNFN